MYHTDVGVLIFRSTSSDMKVLDSKQEDSEEAAGWIIEQSVFKVRQPCCVYNN